MHYAKSCFQILLFIFISSSNFAQSGWVQTELNSTGDFSLYSADAGIYPFTENGSCFNTGNGMPGFPRLRQVLRFATSLIP